jgi:hypothetical protein
MRKLRINFIIQIRMISVKLMIYLLKLKLNLTTLKRKSLLMT